MECIWVISGVEELRDWRAGMVVVPKKDKSVLICMDLTKMNEAVCREKYFLPLVDQTLGVLVGVQIFSKLDAKLGILANTTH